MQALVNPNGTARMAEVTHPFFTLKVRQQPERARLCSYKEENETIDRRPVDPPPVVELRSREIPLEDLLESTSFFIRATIVAANPVTLSVPDHGSPPVKTPVYPPIKTPIGTDATTGEIVQTPEKLRLLDGRAAALCIFAKLSVRAPGVFRLMFTLYETSESGIREITQTVSEPFEVYSPKLFRGMHESTPLTRHLAAQGLKVKLRTDTTVGRQGVSRRRPSIQKPTSRPATMETRTSSSSSQQASSSRSSSARQSPHDNNYRTLPSGLSPQESRSVYNNHRPPSHAEASPRSLVWRHTAEPLESESPGLETTGKKRRYGDDGMAPSFKEMTARYDWPPTPPSNDLSAFSLFHREQRPPLSPHPPPQPLSHLYGPPSRDPQTWSSQPNPPSHRTSSSRSSSSRAAPSPFRSSSDSTPYSMQTRTSSARSDFSTASSVLPSPFTILSLGPGDDGIPILPLPHMYASSPLSGGFIAPSVNQVLERPSLGAGRTYTSSTATTSTFPPSRLSYQQSSGLSATSSPGSSMIVDEADGKARSWSYMGDRRDDRYGRDDGGVRQFDGITLPPIGPGADHQDKG